MFQITEVLGFSKSNFFALDEYKKKIDRRSEWHMARPIKQLVFRNLSGFFTGFGNLLEGEGSIRYGFWFFFLFFFRVFLVFFSLLSL